MKRQSKLFYLVLGIWATIVILMIISHACKGQGCTKADVMVLADLSSSINDKVYIQNAFVNLTERLDLGEERIRMSQVVFADLNIVLTPLTHDKSKLLIGANNMFMMDIGLGTNMIDGLVNGVTSFLKHSRSNAYYIIIVISDGDIQNSLGALETFAKIKQLYNFHVYSIFVKGGFGKDFMQKISSVGYVETTYEDLAQTINEIDICF